MEDGGLFTYLEEFLREENYFPFFGEEEWIRLGFDDVINAV